MKSIEKKLIENPGDYSAYMELGDYYSKTNPDMAYLCYENATYLFSKSNVEKDECFDSKLAELKSNQKSYAKNDNVDVRKVAIIILSYNTLDFTRQTIESVRQKCNPETYELIVVDNNSTDGSVDWLREQSDIILIVNDFNAGFAGGCNQGIEAASEGCDVFLLNSDTVVMDNSLFCLRMGLYSDEKVGMTGSCSNFAGQTQNITEMFDNANDYMDYAYHHNIPISNKYQKKSFLAGFAVLIKNQALMDVGLLDTDFGIGNFEDVDYGLRMIELGYKNLLCWDSFILHYGCQSFLGAKMDYTKMFKTNKGIIDQKWGIDVEYYLRIEDELIALIDEQADSEFSVLEIGCGFGETLNRLQYIYPNCHTAGVENLPGLVQMGATLQNIICADVESEELPFEKNSFDYIIFSDELENTIDPNSMLSTIKEYLKPNGKLAFSVHNMMNAENIHELLTGHFRREKEGIRGFRHLSFYTINDIVDLLNYNGFRIIKNAMTTASDHSTDDFGDFFDKICAVDGVGDRALFNAYQFLVVATPI